MGSQAGWLGRHFRVAIWGVAVVFAAVSLGIVATPSRGGDPAPTEVIVSLRPGTEAAEIARSIGALDRRPVPWRPDLTVLTVPEGAADAVVQALEARHDVAFAARNQIARATAATNDPLLRRQWHLADRATSPGSSNWLPIGSATLGAGSTVAVLDTGVTAHPDIDGLLTGYDFVDKDADATDLNGHGTHVAGTVAESAGNGVGAAGVAPGASIIPVRVLDASGNGPYDWIFSGIAFATSNGADVVNLSLAGATDSGICDAVSRAVAAGVVVIAATGNASGPVGYPAACPDAIAVGAVTEQGLIAPYSNTGSAVDLTAPGGMAGDLDLDGDPDGVLQFSVFDSGSDGDPDLDPGYYYSSGTSMASPHVAGGAAIVRSLRPAATPAQVRQVLTSTATDSGIPGTDPIFGAGRLDLAAVAVAAQALPGTPAPAPTTAPAPPSEPEPEPDTEPAPPTSDTPSPGPTADPVPEEDPPPESNSAEVERLSGDDRFATAAAVAAARFPAGSSHVWIATGESFADALATGAAAGRRAGPLLLVRSCSMPPSTASELSRLEPDTVIVTGGPAAVCDGVLAHIRSLTGVEPSRVSGLDRFDTAASLSRKYWSGGATTVTLASAGGFADALSGGALAGKKDSPLLLTAACALPPSTTEELRRLRPSTVLVMGGEGAVCEAVVTQVRALTGATVKRVSGTDRYATAAAAARVGWTSGTETVYVASGLGFADGLSAGVAAAVDGAPLLLVPSCGALPASVDDELGRLDPGQVFAVGGEASICSAMLNQVAAA